VRYALRKYRINPAKDLTLIQFGFMARPEQFVDLRFLDGVEKSG
jgi:hypothetical protein